MNNYCTNCGKKLEKNELVCKNCNTSIIDLPYNYVYKSPKKKKMQKNILIIIGVCILCFLVFSFSKKIIEKVKIDKLQKNYVEPYLERNYSNVNYSIKYDSSGKCIISGDCYFDPSMGCDGHVCHQYEYLNENECKSYYYHIKTDDDIDADNEFIITVFNKDDLYSVVEGKNIYGTDKNINNIDN